MKNRKTKAVSALLALLCAASFTACAHTAGSADRDRGAEKTAGESTEISASLFAQDESEASAQTSGNIASSSGAASDEAVSAAAAGSVSAVLSSEYAPVSAVYQSAAGGLVSAVESKLFTDRDLLQTADLSEARAVAVSSGATVRITEEGVYLISGSAEECTILVDADETEKVQLVLGGVTVENTDFPVIYVVSADKVFVTTLEGTENSLSVTGTFRADSTADGSTNTDAVIFSKEDLTLNGLGSLTVISQNGNGITSKDDLKITGGTLRVASQLDALEANDSVSVCGGTLSIYSNKDGIHCENDEDQSLGWIWIGGGTIDITAKSDGIQGTPFVQIDGGTLTISASEGVEGTYIQINGGSITIGASDDGINASRKSTAYSVVVEVNGGELVITMASGDTDGIDANGKIIVNGGTINITTSGMASFDYDGVAQFNGGTIIINGTEVDAIPSEMMGGFGGGRPGGFGGGGRGQTPDGWGGAPGGQTPGGRGGAPGGRG